MIQVTDAVDVETKKGQGAKKSHSGKQGSQNLCMHEERRCRSNISSHGDISFRRNTTHVQHSRRERAEQVQHNDK